MFLLNAYEHTPIFSSLHFAKTVYFTYTPMLFQKLYNAVYESAHDRVT